MSSSSRLFSENEQVQLPVFISPPELVFSLNKKRSLLTVFNPYGNEAQFRIMTTSPDRFDVSVTKGTIKPNRRIDITIRLYGQKIDELPKPTDEPQTIDYFRITLQVGQIKGNKPIKVYWCLNADLLEVHEGHSHLIGGVDDKTSKFKIKPTKSSPSTPNQSIQLNAPPPASTSQGQRSFSSPRSSLARSIRASDIDHVQNGSNVNLVCTICAMACVIILFLPLALDTELCKKVKSFQDQSTQASSLLSQLTTFFSISYEVKLGCSFALGLLLRHVL